MFANLLREPAPELRLPMGRPLVWKDEAAHRSAFASDAELYALSTLLPGVGAEQRLRSLYLILASSWQGQSLAARSSLERVVRLLLATLPSNDVITVMLALRRARANHKHVSRAIVRYLTESPSLPIARRAALRDVLEHAVGRDVARAASKGKRALPFVRNVPRAETLLAMLYSGGTPLDVEPPPAPIAVDVPRTITATNRGDVAATLVHMYRGGSTEELTRGLSAFVAEAAAKLPRFDGSIALVVDASASTRGYGEREYCTLSQSIALSLVLAQVCPNLQVWMVGGSSEFPPRPAGATDLAATLLDALALKPDVVAIVTDGYENTSSGDLADVVNALPATGVTTPVVVCQSKFTFKDDLTLRRPAPALPEVGFWHEDDFSDVLLQLASRARPELATAYRQALEQRLNALLKD